MRGIFKSFKKGDINLDKKCLKELLLSSYIEIVFYSSIVVLFTLSLLTIFFDEIVTGLKISMIIICLFYIINIVFTSLLYRIVKKSSDFDFDDVEVLEPDSIDDTSGCIWKK